MNARLGLKIIAAVAIGGIIGAASAKLPAPSEEQKAKAEEAKAKAAEVAKKDGELLTKHQDRTAEYYKKSKGGVTKTSATTTAPKK